MLSLRSVKYLVASLLVAFSFSSLAQPSLHTTTNSQCSVRLDWKPSPSDIVAGYYLCYGFRSGQCTNRLDAGSVTNANVAGLVSGSTYYFTVVAYSSYGDEAPPSNEVSYSVTPPTLNQRPTLDSITDLLLQENSAAVTVALTGITSGSATETQPLVVTAFSGTTSVLPHPVVSYTSPNATGSLTLQPRSGASGSAIVTVMVDDGANTNNTVIQTFIVDVVAANRPPTMDPIGNLTIHENDGPHTVCITGLTPGATNEDQTVSLTATSSKPSLITPVVHVDSPSTGTLTFTPAANSSSTATITVVADDGQPNNSITTRSFDVIVVKNVASPTPLTNVTIAPYSTFRYVLTSPFPNGNKANFVLEPGAPEGAKVRKQKNVTTLTWTPTSAYASTTNLITVKATDTSNATISTNLLFVVNVIDYLTISPAMIAVQPGPDASLPLYAVSSDPLSNLTFNVSWPAGKFGNPSITLPSGSIFTSSLEVQGTNLQINLRAPAGRSFSGSNLVASLNFSALSNQSSAFIPMHTLIVSATKPNQGPFVGLFPGLGEIAVVAGQPLLKALSPTNAPRSLTLYGQVGKSYQVLYSTNSLDPSAWQPLTTYTQTNVSHSLTLSGTEPVIFYRLKQQ